MRETHGVAYWAAITVGLLLLLLNINLINLGNAEEAVDSSTTTTDLKAVLEESEVLKLLRDQASQQDKRLEELSGRLEKELHQMEKHFEEMFEKVSGTEKTLEENLKQVEMRVLGQVDEMSQASARNSGSWFWPFMFLIGVVAVAGGFFFYMYRRATKHNHFL